MCTRNYSYPISPYQQAQLLRSAAEAIERDRNVSTRSLWKILRAVDKTFIKFNDGSSATVITHKRSIIYKNANGNIIRIETYNQPG